MSTADDLLRDDEWGATPESAAAAAAYAMLLDTHTCMPGIVVSFDRAALTAQVTPAIQRVFVEKGAVNLPDLVNVPVVFPAGGGLVLTFDLSPGDEVLLHFGERAIDGWWQNGTVLPPSNHRLHDLSDAFATPSPFSQKSSRAGGVSGGVSAGGAELRTMDGSVVVRVDSTGVTLGNAAGASFAVNGDALMTYLGLLATEINALAPGSVPLPPAASPALLCTLVKVK